MATYTIKIVVAGEDRASGPLRQSRDAVDELGQAAGQGGSRISGFAEIAIGALRRMGELATEGALAAGGAIASFVSSAVSQAGDFEAGMNRFSAVVGSALGESGQSLDDFKQLFLDMGAQTQYSAAQAQEAAINLAKGGIEPATLAAGGLEAALNLAAAGELDLAQAAEITAKQYGVWVSASASAAEKAAFLASSADLLAQAANASTVDVEDLALGMANAGGIAKVAGLSFEETVTSLGLIAPGFSSASDAGTSFKTFLSRLIPTTNDQAEAMARLGLLTSDGSSAFYDASGAFIGMEAAAELLSGSLEGLSQEQQSAALMAIFGQDAFRAAALIAEQGAEGYNRFAESMEGMGSAQEQAAARQQGFNFALDSAKGSLETFGIVAGSLVLPALTALLNDGIIPAVNGVTQFVQALSDPSSTIGQWGALLSTLVVPALQGLAVATLTYAVGQLPTMVAGVIASTTAFAAQAAAIAATLIPLAAIGVAVAGVSWAWNDYNEKQRSATQQLLESREWWNQSTAALQAYDAAQLQTNQNIAAAAATVTQLRSQIEGEVEALGRRMAAGQVSDAQYQTEMAAINAKKDALIVATGHLESEIAATNAAAAASLTATNAAATMGGATAAMGGQVALTAEEIQKLGDKITATYEQGGQAVAKYVSTEAAFLDGVEARQAEHGAKIAELEAQKRAATSEEQKAAIDEQIEAARAAYAEQEATAAASYASQQAAQRAHLGQLLIDYTVSQATLGNISKEKAAEITAALEAEYGLQESSSASTFLAMAGHIDEFASSSSGHIDELVGALQEQESAAVESERAMTAMAKEYRAEVIANFVEKGGEAEEYARRLRSIPSRVQTEVHTKYTESGAPAKGSGSPNAPAGPNRQAEARAEGGPIRAGQPYLVGEEGPELVIPEANGTVIPAARTAQLLGARALEAPTTLGGGGGPVSITVAPQITVQGGGDARAVADEVLRQVQDVFDSALEQAVDRLFQGGGVRQ